MSDLQKKLVWVTFFRIAADTVLLAATAVNAFREPEQLYQEILPALFGLVIGVYALSLVFVGWLRWGRSLVALAYMQVVGDVAVASALIYMTGGHDSPFTFIYSLAVVDAAVLLFRRGAIIGAAGSSIALAVLAEGMHQGLIPPPAAFLAPQPIAQGQLVYFLSVHGAAFFLLAALASYLAEMARQSGEKLQKSESDYAALSAEHEAIMRRNERLAALASMAAGLAHEIRNPLASMSGSIELLSRSSPSEEDRRLMDIVLREAERLNELVTEFLAYARPNPPELGALDMGRLVRETIEVFSHDKSAAGVRIDDRIAPELWAAADAGQMRQVMWNLLLNAAQAMPAGGAIRVHGTRDDGTVRVVVEDEGEGIDPADMARIFEPFFTTKQNGTGLGLATVHRIVEAHGGRVEVASERGRGTRFTVALPVVR